MHQDVVHPPQQHQRHEMGRKGRTERNATRSHHVDFWVPDLGSLARLDLYLEQILGNDRGQRVDER
jgi:hypothetical protein